MTVAEVGLRALLLWLLLPAIGLPVSLLVRRRGHDGFLPRLLIWFAIIPSFLGAAYLGALAFAILLGVALTVAWVEIVRLPGGWLGRPARAALMLSILAGLAAWPFMLSRPEGFRFVLVGFSAVTVADIMGYAVGRLRPTMRPIGWLSPGKTLGGYGGALAGALLTAFLLRFAIPAHDVLQTVLMAVVLAVSGAMGDLVGSAVKRRSGVKDFGGALGRQGGVLDRLDSLLCAGWALVVFLTLTGAI